MLLKHPVVLVMLQNVMRTPKWMCDAPDCDNIQAKMCVHIKIYTKCSCVHTYINELVFTEFGLLISENSVESRVNSPLRVSGLHGDSGEEVPHPGKVVHVCITSSKNTLGTTFCLWIEASSSLH